MKTLILILLLIPYVHISQEPTKAPMPPNPRIKVKYDRFSNLISADIAMTVINSESGNRTLDLALLGTVEGDNLTKGPPRVMVLVTSVSKDWLYSRSPHLLQAILDDKSRLTIAEMDRVTGEVLRNGRGVIEQLRASLIPLSKLEQVANAKTVEMKIGRDEFALTKSQIQDIREWLDKLASLSR